MAFDHAKYMRGWRKRHPQIENARREERRHLARIAAAARPQRSPSPRCSCPCACRIEMITSQLGCGFCAAGLHEVAA